MGSVHRPPMVPALYFLKSILLCVEICLSCLSVVISSSHQMHSTANNSTSNPSDISSLFSRILCVFLYFPLENIFLASWNLCFFFPKIKTSGLINVSPRKHSQIVYDCKVPVKAHSALEKIISPLTCCPSRKPKTIHLTSCSLHLCSLTFLSPKVAYL